jgi:hypothetical protein
VQDCLLGPAIRSALLVIPDIVCAFAGLIAFCSWRCVFVAHEFAMEKWQSKFHLNMLCHFVRLLADVFFLLCGVVALCTLTRARCFLRDVRGIWRSYRGVYYMTMYCLLLENILYIYIIYCYNY